MSPGKCSARVPSRFAIHPIQPRWGDHPLWFGFVGHYSTGKWYEPIMTGAWLLMALWKCLHHPVDKLRRLRSFNFQRSAMSSEVSQYSSHLISNLKVTKENQWLCLLIKLIGQSKTNTMKIHETLRVDIFLFLFIFSAKKEQQQVERVVLCGVFVVGWFRGPQHVGWCCCGKFPKVPRHDRKRSPGRERKKESWKTAIRWVQAFYLNLKQAYEPSFFSQGS